MAATAPSLPDKDREIQREVEGSADQLAHKVTTDEKIARDLGEKIANNTLHLADVLKYFNVDAVRTADPKLKGALAEERVLALAITMLTKHAGAAAGSAKTLLDGLVIKINAEKKRFEDLHRVDKGVTTADDSKFDTLYQSIFSSGKGVEAARDLLRKVERYRATHGISVDAAPLQTIIDEIVRVTKATEVFDFPDAATQEKIKKLTKSIAADEVSLSDRIQKEKDKIDTKIADEKRKKTAEDAVHAQKKIDIEDAYQSALRALPSGAPKTDTDKEEHTRNSALRAETTRHDGVIRPLDASIATLEDQKRTADDRLTKKLEKKKETLKKLKKQNKAHTVYSSLVPYSALRSLQVRLEKEFDAVSAKTTRIDTLKADEPSEAPAKFAEIDVSQYEKLKDVKTYDELIGDAYTDVLDKTITPAQKTKISELRDAYIRIARESHIATTLTPSSTPTIKTIAECERLEKELAGKSKSQEYVKKLLDTILGDDKHPYVLLKKLVERRRGVRAVELEVARLAGSGDGAAIEMANQKLANEKKALREFEVKTLGKSRTSQVYAYITAHKDQLDTTNYAAKTAEVDEKISQINRELSVLRSNLHGEESAIERKRLEERIKFLERTLRKLEQIALERRTRQETVDTHNKTQKLEEDEQKIYEALQNEFSSRFIEQSTGLGIRGGLQKMRMGMGGVVEVNFFGKVLKMPFAGNKLRRMARLMAEKNRSTNTLLEQYRAEDITKSPWHRAIGVFSQWRERNFLRSQQKKIDATQASLDRSAQRLLDLEKKKMERYEQQKTKHGPSAYIEEQVHLRAERQKTAQDTLKKLTDPTFLEAPKNEAEQKRRAEQREQSEDTMHSALLQDLAKGGVTAAMYPKSRFVEAGERKEALKLYFGKLAVSRYPEGLKRLKVFTDFLKTKEPDIAYQFSATHLFKLMGCEEDLLSMAHAKKDFTSEERCERLWKEKKEEAFAADPRKIFTPRQFFTML